MQRLIDWLLQPTTDGATRLQAILLCAVLVAVILYGVKMFEEFVREYKQLQEDSHNEEDL